MQGGPTSFFASLLRKIGALPRPSGEGRSPDDISNLTNVLATVLARDDGDNNECKAEGCSTLGPCSDGSQDLGQAADAGGDDESSTLGSCSDSSQDLRLVDATGSNVAPGMRTGRWHAQL